MKSLAMTIMLITNLVGINQALAAVNEAGVSTRAVTSVTDDGIGIQPDESTNPGAQPDTGDNSGDQPGSSYNAGVVPDTSGNPGVQPSKPAPVGIQPSNSSNPGLEPE
jgi:hypothetical protein